MPQLLNPDAEYPFIRDALEFLRDKEVLPHSEYTRLSRTQKLRVIGSSAIQTALQASRLKALVIQSVKEGESESQFRARIRDHVDVMRSEANTILRTNTKQAYVAGQSKTIEKPAIKAAFPYAMFVATHDARTRDLHDELDGFVVEVGTPEYHVLQAARRDWNCRCALISLTAKQCERRVIKTYADLPASIVAKYGSLVA